MMAGDTRLADEAHTIESPFVPKVGTPESCVLSSSGGSQADAADRRTTRAKN